MSLALGVDDTQDNYYAINSEGSLYDDEVGGPAFVDGEGGLELPELTEVDLRYASERAKLILAAMEAPTSL